ASRGHGRDAVGIIVSAQASNEEIALLRRIGQALGATVAGISWSPPDAYHDDLLIKADKNPNTRGLALQGIPLDGTAHGLLEARAAGRLQPVTLHRTNLTACRDAARVRAALERLPYLVILDTDQREVLEYASVILPVGTHAESDGTFTNHAGCVQRFRPAVATPGDARPGWAVLADILGRLSGGASLASAEAGFALLASEHRSFRRPSSPPLPAPGEQSPGAGA